MNTDNRLSYANSFFYVLDARQACCFLSHAPPSPNKFALKINLTFDNHDG
jgi:hypothetical protein